MQTQESQARERCGAVLADPQLWQQAMIQARAAEHQAAG